MSDYQVYFYQTRRGDQLVKDFILRQDKATYAKILRSIKLIRDNGPFLKPPFVKKITRHIYELRIQGKDSIRIFYVKFRNGYCLLHIFKKKSQKILRKDLKIAVDRAREIL